MKKQTKERLYWRRVSAGVGGRIFPYWKHCFGQPVRLRGIKGDFFAVQDDISWSVLEHRSGYAVVQNGGTLPRAVAAAAMYLQEKGQEAVDRRIQECVDQNGLPPDLDPSNGEEL